MVVAVSSSDEKLLQIGQDDKEVLSSGRSRQVVVDSHPVHLVHDHGNLDRVWEEEEEEEGEEEGG